LDMRINRLQDQHAQFVAGQDIRLPYRCCFHRPMSPSTPRRSPTVPGLSAAASSWAHRQHPQRPPMPPVRQEQQTREEWQAGQHQIHRRRKPNPKGREIPRCKPRELDSADPGPASETSHQPFVPTVAPSAQHVRNAFFTSGDAPHTATRTHGDGSGRS
jgi:hypothetical protein